MGHSSTSCARASAFAHAHTLWRNAGLLSQGAFEARSRATELVNVFRWMDCDMPAVWAWVRCEARCELLTEWLGAKGSDLDGDENVRPAADLLNRLTKQAESMRSKLGLDPLSRARLGRDAAAGAVDLARLWFSENDSGPEIESVASTSQPIVGVEADRPVKAFSRTAFGRP